VTPAVEALLDQALQLAEDERGELAARLLRSLEPVDREGGDDDDGPATQEWEAAWSAELDRRVREVREGRVQLVDGDDVMAELREIARRP
jgi:hypothetical protein